MWSEGRHFCISSLDTKRSTQDSGVMATFENANGEMEDFCGIVMSILKFDYRTLNIHALDVKWFNEPLHRSINVNIRRHASGIFVINSTRVWETKKEYLVLPQHCEQVLMLNSFVKHCIHHEFLLLYCYVSRLSTIRILMMNDGGTYYKFFPIQKTYMEMQIFMSWRKRKMETRPT